MAFKTKNPVTVFLFLFFPFFSSILVFCQAVNTITKGQSIKDGEILESVNGNFKLGFFSLENSTSRYFGIRYNKIQDQAVIWIANRDNPISDRNAVFTIGEDGNLIVRDGNGNSVWSTNTSVLSNNTAAILEETGNLVLSGRDDIGDLDKPYWQSFNHPTDTYLPDMKVLASAAVGEITQVFTSWKSATDPSPGNFIMGVDPRAAPQIVICEQSRRRIWRSGHWNGLLFTGVLEMAAVTNYQYGFKYTKEDDGNWYFTYHPSNPSDLMRFQITWDGFEEQLKWNRSENKWGVMQKQPANECEHYNYCGNFGVCSATDSLKCSCMEGFEPKDRNQWSKGNWSSGCVRRSALRCQGNATVAGETGQDGFKLLKSMKLPDFADAETARSLDNCKDICLRDCSCKAFAFVGGIGCMLWRGELIDVQIFEKGGNTLYVRLADSELGGRKIAPIVIVAIVVGGVIFLAISIWVLWKLKTRRQASDTAASVSRTKKSEIPISDLSKSKEYSTDFSGQIDLIDGSQVSGPELPLFSFSIVASATDNFSEEHKLGQGGFGLVYKGKLPGGEEIAVKRLSRISGQGLEEFKNEIILIAKLQHRNLVRLLGCCIQGEEKILLYEYMPNKSLDFFLFDSTKQVLLDWKKRVAIIEGIARGLLYLHRDSRLRIIHRDLKASNILLDEEMNPKISDFGMARIFGGNQNEANTNRVVGTYGYMAPEYAMEGLFSVKSDVYSFGVLLLEIISGRRNTSFRLSDHINLINYAWQLWEERRTTELIDPSIRDSCDQNEVSRCIQVGMLCVQDSAYHRPTMASVVLMLESSNTILPLPRQPTFNSIRASIDTDLLIDGQEVASSNDLTVTMVVGR